MRLVSSACDRYLSNNENFQIRQQFKYLVNELYVEIIVSRSKHANLPIFGKARTEPFSQLKLPTNGEVLQRFNYRLKVVKLSKNIATNVTYDKDVDLCKNFRMTVFKIHLL